MMIRFLAVLFLLWGGLSWGRAMEPLPEGSFYVSYTSRPSMGAILAHDWSILAADAEFDRDRVRAAGRPVLGYLSVGEVDRGASYRQRVLDLKIPFLGLNSEWKSDAVDVSSPVWRRYVVEELAQDLVRRGFDGFFLDTLDTVESLAGKHPEKADALRAGLADLVRDLRQRFPHHRIVLNRGFDLAASNPGIADAVLVESLYGTYDFATKSYREMDSPGSQWLLDRMEALKKRGIPVFVLDYADDPAKARGYAKKIRDHGYCPMVGTIELMGKVWAPVVPVKRRILCLYGSTGKSSDAVHFPIDTRVSKLLQMPLEWMGYEVDYRDLASGWDLANVSGEWRAVIVEPTMRVPAETQRKLADWLGSEIQRGTRLVIFQNLPLSDSSARNALGKILGTRFQSGSVAGRPSRFSIQSSLMGFEQKMAPVLSTYPKIEAPAGAEIHLQGEFLTPQGHPWKTDLVFTTSWGGVAMDPGMTLPRLDGVEFWLVDPWKFLEKALGPDFFPAPETTTRDGLRILYSHVDADGFSDRSEVERGARSAGIIRDHIFKKYPYPVAASIIGLEVRGEMRGQDKNEVHELEELARSIFALPQVEAASHTWTHPFVWMQNDRTLGMYEFKSIAGDQAKEVQVRLSQEINESLDLIQSRLTPQQTKPKLFLWSGNCRPGEAALRQAREAGVVNMNGGFTDYSTWRPSLTRVSPRGIPWGREYQVFSAVQNDNIYTDEWKGPYYGGYSRVIGTFQRTESPRRLKPVGVYYHFFSGDRWDSLEALKTVFDWTMKQPLHPVWPSQYARIVMDARDCEIYQVSTDHWRLITQGELRSFRIPRSGRVPDLTRSRGVTGFREEREWIYVHTQGAPVCDLILTDRRPVALTLESSTAEVKVEELTVDSAKIAIQGFQPARLVFSGVKPGSRWVIRAAAEKKITQVADDQGRFSVTVSSVTVLEVNSAR